MGEFSPPLFLSPSSIMLMHRPQTPQPGFGSITLLQKLTPHFNPGFAPAHTGLFTIFTSCATFVRPCTGTCMVIILYSIKCLFCSHGGWLLLKCSAIGMSKLLFHFFVWPKPKMPFLGLSLFRNKTEMLATQATEIWEILA